MVLLIGVVLSLMQSIYMMVIIRDRLLLIMTIALMQLILVVCEIVPTGRYFVIDHDHSIFDSDHYYSCTNVIDSDRHSLPGRCNRSVCLCFVHSESLQLYSSMSKLCGPPFVFIVKCNPHMDRGKKGHS